jgi:hypothetical protein
MKKRSAILGLAAAFLLHCEQATGPAASADACGPGFAEARSDPSLRREYAAARTECDSGAQEAMATGKLLGILYDPGEAELKSEMGGKYRALGYSADLISDLTDVTLDALARTEGLALAEISSTDLRYYGMGIPVFIILKEPAFTSPVLVNEYDARSILIHESQHAKDWHDGMRAGSLFAGASAYGNGSAGGEWLVQLMELRAVYRELAEAYEPMALSDTLRISYAWFASRASSYRLHWNRVDSLARTGFERAINAAQKSDFQGIVPESIGDRLLLHFDLLGKKLTANFVASHAAPKAATDPLAPGGEPVFTGWKDPW